MMKSSLVGVICFLVLLSFLPSLTASTGLEAEQVAEKIITPKVKGKLIWGRSEESTSTSPSNWSFLYFDPYASNNGRLVQVSGHSIRKISEGLVELDKARLASYKQDEVLPLTLIKIDSDKALSILKEVAGLDQFHITKVDYILSEDSTNAVPSWKLTLFGSKHDGDETEFGSARVSAITGQVFSLDIKANKLQ